MYIHILLIYICTCVQIYTYFLIFQPPRSEVNRFLCLHPSCPKEKLIRDQRLQGFQGQKNEFPFLQFESQTELRTTTKLMMKKNICLVQEKAKTAEKIATCNGIYLSFTGKKKCVKIPARQYITFIVICFSSTSSSIIPSSPRTGHCKVQIAPCTKPPQDAWPRFFGLTNSVLSMEVWFSDTLMLWMVGCLSVYHRLSIFIPLFIGFDT